MAKASKTKPARQPGNKPVKKTGEKKPGRQPGSKRTKKTVNDEPLQAWERGESIDHAADESNQIIFNQ